MSFKQFDMTGIEENKKKYAEEVKTRWGNTAAYTESEEKTSSYSDSQWNNLNGECQTILKEFGECRNLEPGSNEVQALVKKWQDYLTANFYNCTKEILSGLGQMYIGDERFKNNIDQHGEGTAELIAAAIEIYCR